MKLYRHHVRRSAVRSTQIMYFFRLNCTYFLWMHHITYSMVMLELVGQCIPVILIIVHSVIPHEVNVHLEPCNVRGYSKRMSIILHQNNLWWLRCNVCYIGQRDLPLVPKTTIKEQKDAIKLRCYQTDTRQYTMEWVWWYSIIFQDFIQSNLFVC